MWSIHSIETASFDICVGKIHILEAVESRIYEQCSQSALKSQSVYSLAAIQWIGETTQSASIWYYIYQ